MKQKDLASIAIVVVISAILSFIISNKVFVTPSNRQQQVEVVQPISSTLTAPDPTYINGNDFDPTQSFSISQNANPNPFNSSPQ